MGGWGGGGCGGRAGVGAGKPVSKDNLAQSQRCKEVNQLENTEDLCLRGFTHKLDENWEREKWMIP